MDLWFDRPLDRRAPAGGLIGVDGEFRRGGEFEPFYVPRPAMPQIDEADYPALFDFADAQGVHWGRVILPPQIIHPHQRVNVDKARHMDDATLAKPILVSVEPNVLDGNHRWYAHKERNTPVPCVQFALPFEDAVKFLFSFPGGTDTSTRSKS